MLTTTASEVKPGDAIKVYAEEDELGLQTVLIYVHQVVPFEDNIKFWDTTGGLWMFPADQEVELLQMTLDIHGKPVVHSTSDE